MKTKLLLVFLLFPVLGFAQTYTFSTLANFPNSSKKGAAYPSAPTIDSSGNIYGVSAQGGTYNQGTVFKVTPTGALSVLFSFGATPTDGTIPFGTVIRDSAGNLYGLTSEGGANDTGIVFKVTPAGKETILHSFSSAVGVICPCPEPSLTRDSKGNLYGYDLGTNFGEGSVFKITSAGVYSTLYNFCSLANCIDGDHPESNLLLDAAGNLYGIASEGGNPVFKITPAGVETVLLDPPGPAGFGFALTMDQSGNLYGTNDGGPNHTGSVYKLTKH